MDKEVIEDLEVFIDYIKKAPVTKERKYVGSDEYSRYVNVFLTEKLNAVGFKSGNKEYNSSKPLIKFWWSIYTISNSSNFDLLNENHHCSTHDRQTILLINIKSIVEYIKGNTAPKLKRGVRVGRRKIKFLYDYTPKDFNDLGPLIIKAVFNEGYKIVTSYNIDDLLNFNRIKYK